jgi:glycosyltransferase involved in cell wall biosynthesis
MKICLVANPNSAHTRRWITYFIKNGHEVHLIGEHKPSSTLPEDLILHDLTVTTNAKKYRYVRWGLEVRRIIKNIQPDILHALGAVSAGWLGYFSGFHPFITTVLGSDVNLLSKKNFFFQILTLTSLQHSDFVFCVSNDLAQKVEFYGIKKEKIKVIYLGIDAEIFCPPTDKLELRQRYGMGTNPIVISIRAMNWIYNPLAIAKAIPIVARQLPDIKFLVFTYNKDEALLNEFKELISQSNTAASVEYIDEISDDRSLSEYYQLADLAISIPTYDGTPNSVMECMACGTPVILSNLPTLLEWVTPNETGIFIPHGNIHALSEAIIYLLTNPSLREEMGYEASTNIRQRMDRRFWMSYSENIYQQLIEKKT